MCEQKKLFMEIQQYSFVLYETALYLDTHPNCSEALEYFEKYNCKLHEATAEYEAKFGPLTFFGHSNSDKWQWVCDPWPWEYDCQTN